jgi:ribose transport system permease protein
VLARPERFNSRPPDRINPRRTAVGLAIFATISNGFTLIGLNPLHQGIVKGVIIILALAIDGWTSRIPRYRRG